MSGLRWRLFRRFSHEIWKSLECSAYERAEYLKSLFLDVVGQVVFSSFYLDVGAGLGCNSIVFGRDAKQIVATDLCFPMDNLLKGCDKACMIVADAHYLPFKSGIFDIVSIFRL